LAVWPAATLARAAETADALRQSALTIIRLHDLQGEMPGPTPPPPDWWRRLVETLDRGGAWLGRHVFHYIGDVVRWLLHLLGRVPGLHVIGDAIDWLIAQFEALNIPPLGKLALAALALILICGLGFWLVETVALRRRRAAAPVSAAAIDGAPADLPAQDADELARQGRYAEAIHALLIHSLTLLRRRFSRSMADCLTSREIVASVALPEPARDALDDLVARVELGHFGLYPVLRRDYDFCRDRFALLVAAMATGVPA
jgi:hypothetical protein